MTFTIPVQWLMFASGFLAGVALCVVWFFAVFFHAAKDR